MGRNSAWQKEIRKRVEDLPVLYKPRQVRLVKSGREIVDEFESDQLKEFRAGLKAEFGTDEIDYQRQYHYMAEIKQPINHTRKMKELVRKFGRQGIQMYCEQVEELAAQIEADEQFKDNKRFYHLWLFNLQRLFVWAKNLVTPGAGKSGGSPTKV
jgi:hypothetical protein